MTIKAISFDLWDTLVDDDSDEQERARKKLRTKHAERRHLCWQALNAQEPIDFETVSQAYDVADAAFNLVWKENHINWRLEQRLRVIIQGLNRRLPPKAFNQLVDETGSMEVEIPPNPIPGVREALAELSGSYRLCVVSDAIVTPGTGLRQVLDHHGLKQFFQAFAFSDEVGHSKPHYAMFESVCRQLNIEAPELIHIGDRDHNDVKGIHAAGGKAILFTATRDSDRSHTTADAICDDYQQLPGVVQQIAAGSSS